MSGSRLGPTCDSRPSCCLHHLTATAPCTAMPWDCYIGGGTGVGAKLTSLHADVVVKLPTPQLSDSRAPLPTRPHVALRL